MIEREGAEVVYTSNGDDVMRILSTEKIDALVVDNRMPGRWGVDIALALLETRPDLPIIITTANVLGVIAPKNVLLVVDKSELPKMLDTLRWAIGLYPECAVSA
jgi:DNA-binding NtrC family response regulator